MEEDDLNYLEEFSGSEIPKSILNLPPDTIKDIRLFIEKSYESKMMSIRKAMKANNMTLKILPNFIIHSVLKIYVDPPMAGFIAECLEPSLISGILSGLDPEYISEAAISMDSEKCAKIIFYLDKSILAKTLNLILSKKPLKLLDIIGYVPETVLKKKNVSLNTEIFNSFPNLSHHRKTALEKLK